MNTKAKAEPEVQEPEVQVEKTEEEKKAETIALIQGWAEGGDSTKKIRAKLVLADWSDKQISAGIQAAGVGRVTAGFTQTNTLSFLETGVTEYQLYEVILENGAKNEARWIGDRNRIRVTLNKIYANFDSPVDEKEATATQKKAIKALLK